MLVRLVHEGSDGSLPAWLKCAVTRRVKIRNPPFRHQWLYNGGRYHTRHAREGIDVHDAVKTCLTILQNRRHTETGLRCDVEREQPIFSEDLFQVRHFVIIRQVYDGLYPFVGLALPELLVKQVGTEMDYLGEIPPHRGQVHPFQA